MPNPATTAATAAAAAAAAVFTLSGRQVQAVMLRLAVLLLLRLLLLENGRQPRKVPAPFNTSMQQVQTRARCSEWGDHPL